MAPPTPRRQWFAYVVSICSLLLAVSLPGFVQAQAPPPTITITDLTPRENHSHAKDINDRGQIVGQSITNCRLYHDPDHGDELRCEYHAVLWENGTTIDLGTFGGDLSWATAINEHGQIVVNLYSDGGDDDALLWENGTIIDLGTLGGGYSHANDINEQGQIVGSTQNADNAPHAFLWENGTMTDLGTLGGNESYASAINNLGQIVGTSQTATGEYHAVLWQNGTIVDLGTLGGDQSFAHAINDRGQIVGTNQTATGEHAFLRKTGTMTDLGPGSATDINDQGQIVGTSGGHAVLWENGKMTDLGMLGGDSSIAYGINEHGQIVGASHTATGEQHAVLWEITHPPRIVRGLDAELNLTARCDRANADGTLTVSGRLAITNQSEDRQTLRIGTVNATMFGKINGSDTNLASLTTTATTLTTDVQGLVLAPNETRTIPYRSTFRPGAHREFALDVEVTLQTSDGTGQAAKPRSDREEFARCRQ